MMRQRLDKLLMEQVANPVCSLLLLDCTPCCWAGTDAWLTWLLIPVQYLQRQNQGRCLDNAAIVAPTWAGRWTAAHDAILKYVLLCRLCWVTKHLCVGRRCRISCAKALAFVLLVRKVRFLTCQSLQLCMAVPRRLGEILVSSHAA